MTLPTPTAVQVRAALGNARPHVAEVLARYGAANLRMFGSVARGDAREGSDLDLLVDLLPGHGNELLRVAGLAEELSDILGLGVDVVAPTLLRDEVSSSALADAVAV
jgi:predicted nucleotidyltransferase